MDLTPDLELPDLYEPYPEELLILCNESLKGLISMSVHRQLERGRYKLLCSVKIQERPTKESIPTYQPEDVCEVAMKIIANDVIETDDPGHYKVTFIGVGGNKGRKTRSKHIRLSELTTPRAVNQLDEADLIEAQMSYILELQSSNLNLMEIVSGMVSPLLQQNKDLSKTVTDSVQRISEVEALRMAHELQMRQIEDENRQELARQKMEQDRWSELFGHVKNTGAVEALLAGAMAHFGPGAKKKKKERKGDVINAEQRFRQPGPGAPGAQPSPQDGPSSGEVFPDAKALAATVQKAESAMVRVDDEESSPAEAEERNSQTPEPPPSETEQPDVEEEGFDEEAADIVDLEEEQQRHIEHARQMMEESPLVFVAQSLKQSIDQKKQWKVIYKTLSPEQVDIFDAITAAKTDDEVMEHLQELTSTEPHRLLMLRGKMDDQQQKFVDVLFNAAVSGKHPFEDDSEGEAS